ncbi:uncharacterized [Tachysurus ichikawai]
MSGLVTHPCLIDTDFDEQKLVRGIRGLPPSEAVKSSHKVASAKRNSADIRSQLRDELSRPRTQKHGHQPEKT